MKNLTKKKVNSFLLILTLSIFFVQSAYPFSFAQEEAKPLVEQAIKQDQIASLLATPCGKSLKDQKIALMIAESSNDGFETKQSKYGQFFEILNKKLKKTGFKTYTDKEIQNQIAQAEIKAYMSGDTDAAIGAAKKLAANFLLKGVIGVTSSQNKVINVNEINVNINFSLTTASGKTVSTISKTYSSYSGADTYAMALKIAQEEGDEVIAKLYSDFCNNLK